MEKLRESGSKTIPKTLEKGSYIDLRIEKTDGCWNWLGCTEKAYGYGTIRILGKAHKAHRLVYVLSGNIIPEGLTLDHLCRNRRCVNPAHLEPVTIKENVLRGFSPNAMNARKTHCPRNHEYNQENTYFLKSGRQCKKCNHIRCTERDRIKREQKALYKTRLAGVYKKRNGWEAHKRVGSKVVYIGRASTELAAHKLYVDFCNSANIKLTPLTKLRVDSMTASITKRLNELGK